MLRCAVAVLSAAAACGPKVSPGNPFDEDLRPRAAEVSETPAAGSPAAAESPRAASLQVGAAAPAAPAAPPRADAPPGKGLRTGTIERAKLIAVLDAGPGKFLRQLEVTPRMDGNRFVGWQLVQLLDRDGPLVDVDVVPGDVLLAVNGRIISRPDQLQATWDSLRYANELRAQLWRGDAKLELAFAIEPKVDPSKIPAPKPTPAPEKPASAKASPTKPPSK